MKKIAILGSNGGSLFEAVVKHIKDKFDITCLSDNIKSEILHKAKDLSIKNQYLPYEENAGFFGAENFDLIILCDYDKELSEETIELGRFVNIHPSLLPSFKGKDAIYRAFESGVKVSGVTVHWVTNELDGGKIIAQYPVLIGNTTHFDEFETEIHALEETLYPRVIDAILKDKVFDFSDLLSSGGCGHCSGGNCGGCH